MSIRCITAGAFLIIFLSCSQAGAATCLSGGCHQDLLTPKYLHGPVAAEEMGAKGCVACHVPAGRACSASKAGAFTPLASAIQMCKTCHERGTGTQHSVKKIDCLKCHDPHGSAKGPELKR